MDGTLSMSFVHPQAGKAESRSIIRLYPLPPHTIVVGQVLHHVLADAGCKKRYNKGIGSRIGRRQMADNQESTFYPMLVCCVPHLCSHAPYGQGA